MYLFLEEGFLSVVKHRDIPASVLIRARKREHLTAYVNSDKIEHTPTADYPYRATLPIGMFNKILCEYVLAISYDNFKMQVGMNTHKKFLETGEHDVTYHDQVYDAYYVAKDEDLYKKFASPSPLCEEEVG